MNLRKFWGCFFRHIGKWGPMHKQSFIDSDTKEIMSESLVQDRICDDCGAVSRRKIA